MPTGIFYAQGVKANVLFFDRKATSETAWTNKLWIYDLRTNKHSTLKSKTLARTGLDQDQPGYLLVRDGSLGDSDDLPDPAILAAEIAADRGNGRREGG